MKLSLSSCFHKTRDRDDEDGVKDEDQITAKKKKEEKRETCGKKRKRW